MIEPSKDKAKIQIPPAWLGIQAVGMIGIGLAIAEIFPKHGQSPGLIPSGYVMPVLWVSVVVAALTTFKIIGIIRRFNRENPPATDLR